MNHEYQIIAFKTEHDWRQWLLSHHAEVDGLWLRIYKKGSSIATVTYAEALDQALCFGWIDGQKKSNDEISFLQKFTPRRPRSLWSKRNREHVARLNEAGLMAPSGAAEVELARKDGRWDAAYDAPSTMQVPNDFMLAIQQNKKTLEFFHTLNKTNLYAIAWQLQTARTSITRKRRLISLVAMLERGEMPR